MIYACLSHRRHVLGGLRLLVLLPLSTSLVPGLMFRYAGRLRVGTTFWGFGNLCVSVYAFAF